MTRKMTPDDDDFDHLDWSVDERIAWIEQNLKVPPYKPTIPSYAPPVQSTKPKETKSKSAVSKRANANKAKERSEQAHKDIGDFPNVVPRRPLRPAPNPIGNPVSAHNSGHQTEGQSEAAHSTNPNRLLETVPPRPVRRPLVKYPFGHDFTSAKTSERES